MQVERFSMNSHRPSTTQPVEVEFITIIIADVLLTCYEHFKACHFILLTRYISPFMKLVILPFYTGAPPLCVALLAVIVRTLTKKIGEYAIKRIFPSDH